MALNLKNLLKNSFPFLEFSLEMFYTLGFFSCPALLSTVSSSILYPLLLLQEAETSAFISVTLLMTSLQRVFSVKSSNLEQRSV